MSGAQRTLAVSFPLERDEDGFPPFDKEVMWVREVSGTGVCEVLGIPLFVVGISKGDLISCSSRGSESLEFQELLSARGHSTVRVIFFQEGQLGILASTLKGRGCSVHLGAVEDYIAIDIPPSVEYAPVLALIDAGSTRGLWDYEESCVSREHAGY